MQTIVIWAADTRALEALLAANGIATRQGLSLVFEPAVRTHSTRENVFVDGAPLAGIFCAILYDTAQAGEQRMQEIRTGLGDALWHGELPAIANWLGVAPYTPPTGADAIRAARQRLQLNGGFPLQYQGQTVWWHSNYQSRDQQMGLMMAGVVGVLKAMMPAQQWAAVTAAPMVNPKTGKQQTWRMMGGGDVSLTVGLMFDLLLAAMGQEGAIDAAAQAAIVAGTAPDAVQWPATYQG
jgi:hypothetical protein